MVKAVYSKHPKGKTYRKMWGKMWRILGLRPSDPLPLYTDLSIFQYTIHIITGEYTVILLYHKHHTWTWLWVSPGRSTGAFNQFSFWRVVETVSEDSTTGAKPSDLRRLNQWKEIVYRSLRRGQESWCHLRFSILCQKWGVRFDGFWWVRDDQYPVHAWFRNRDQPSRTFLL